MQVETIDCFIDWFRPEALMSDDSAIYRRLSRSVTRHDIARLYDYLDLVMDGWVLAEIRVVNAREAPTLTWKILAVKPMQFGVIPVTGAGRY